MNSGMNISKDNDSDHVLLTDHPWPDLNIEQQIFGAAGIRFTSGPMDAGTAQEIEGLVTQIKPTAIMTCWAPVSAAAIGSAPGLRIVARLGVGLDNIAVETASQQNVWVTNVPDYCVQEVSDHAIALLLAHCRKIVQNDRDIKTSCEWNQSGTSPERISDLTVGIVGFGRIGRATATKLQAFGCRILVSQPGLQEAPNGIEVSDLTSIQSEANVIILHLPLKQSTQHLINDRFLELCQCRPLLINVSRGGLIDNAALLRALINDKLSGAALDVIEDEPHPPKDILTHPRVIVTPHIAFLSTASLLELRKRTCEEVVRVLRGQLPQQPCNSISPTDDLNDKRLAGGVASNIRLVQGKDGLYVVKQALEKLRTSAEWLSDPARSSTEVAALREIAGLLGQDTVPEVLWVDEAENTFAMRQIDPRLSNWKQDLMAGDIDDRTAAQAGSLVGSLHSRSATVPVIRDRFDDLTYFETLRINPYFLRLVEKNQQLAAVIEDIIAGMLNRRSALVHGDFSPKNILADASEVVILDCEVAHWGDPRFDVAFCLAHLFLKSHRRGAPVGRLAACSLAFLDAYKTHGPDIVDAELVRILGCLILARLDGDSPVDYLDDLDTSEVREIATSMICDPHVSPETYFPLNSKEPIL